MAPKTSFKTIRIRRSEPPISAIEFDTLVKQLERGPSTRRGLFSQSVPANDVSQASVSHRVNSQIENSLT